MHTAIFSRFPCELVSIPTKRSFPAEFQPSRPVGTGAKIFLKQVPAGY